MFTAISKKVSCSVVGIADAVRVKFGAEASQPSYVAAFFAIFIFFVIVPLELSQLTFALFGAMTYALLQTLQVRPHKGYEGKGTKFITSRKVEGSPPRGLHRPMGNGIGRPSPQRTRAPYKDSRVRHEVPAMPAAPKVEVRKPSSQPVSAPVFQAKGWDAEVDELLGQIVPTVEGDRVVKAVADFVEQRIKPLIPEVEVMGFTTGDPVGNGGTAFGVAVPEVDIVVNVSPQILVQRLQGWFSKGSLSTTRLDIRKLQKSAIRACTDRLVSNGGFKFRRSAFRGDEPKVTLLVPASFGISGESIPIDFTVNSTTPFYNVALLTECGKQEARAKALILLVKRWAKDRGVCHAAKGHLSPYPWSLLVIFFLQTGKAGENGGSMLPPVEDFELCSKLFKGTENVSKDTLTNLQAAQRISPASCDDQPKTVGQLFKEFIHFYNRIFDWRKEAVSVRSGKRGSPGLSLPIHIIMNEETQATEVGPSIEDPFNPSRNLGGVMTSTSLARLHREIERADELCAQGCSLTELLEPWAPPEQAEKDGDDDEQEKTGKEGFRASPFAGNKVATRSYQDSKAWGA